MPRSVLRSKDNPMNTFIGRRQILASMTLYRILRDTSPPLSFRLAASVVVVLSSHPPTLSYFFFPAWFDRELPLSSSSCVYAARGMNLPTKP